MQESISGTVDPGSPGVTGSAHGRSHRSARWNFVEFQTIISRLL